MDIVEVWKPTKIAGYEVSNLGRVRSLDRVKTNGRRIRGRVLRLNRGARGYMRVQLWEGGRCTACLVHRLVLEAFEPSPGRGFQVNHKNGRKDDNRLSNLEWLTPGQNVRHARDVLRVQHGHPGERNGQAKLTAEQVREIRARYIPRKNGGIAALARAYGVDQSTVWAVIHTAWRHV